MEVPSELTALEAPAPGLLQRLLADRKLWKRAIYTLAFATYLCSFLFLVLAIVDVSNTGGRMLTIIDLVVAIYFLTQVIFLFVLSGAVERRRMQQKIDFPNRRRTR